MLSPVGQRELLKEKAGHLAETPEGFVLYANLMVGAPGTPLHAVPAIAGQTLWRTRLKDNRVGVLVGRLFELGQENLERIKYFREEHKLSVTLSGQRTTSKYAELYDVHWSPKGGNVINVLPLWEESFRYEREPPPSGAAQAVTKLFRYQSPYATAELVAPDGMRVAIIEITEVGAQIELAKGIPKRVEVGSLTMRIDPNNLIAGSTIKAFTPCRLSSVPNLSGCTPRGWEYTIYAQFDGSQLSVEIGPLSAALNNKRVVPLSGLDDGEELVIRIPADAVKLSASLNQPSASTKLIGTFTLRNQR